MTRSRTLFVALVATGLGLLTAAPAHAGWENNFAFGASLKADLYTPSTLGSPPAVLVAIHYCSGNKMNAHGWFDSLADKNGFFVIAPDAGKNCFDSSATRGGDRDAIVKMVQYLITNKGADKNRVFAAGYSSGGCMTNTLLAIYPDVFAGGAAMPGFPAGAWPAGDTSCTKCSSQPDHKDDGKYWGDLARKAFSWTGKYPCSEQWVGDADEYNFNGWLSTVASQFVNLSSLGAAETGSGAPSGWARKTYKNAAGVVWLETNTKSGQKHDLTGSGLASSVVSFLSLDKPGMACGLPVAGGTGNGGATGNGGSTGNGGAKGSGGVGGSVGATGGTSGGTGGSTGTGGGSTSASGGATSSSGGATSSSGGATSSSGGATSSSGGATSSSGGATSSSGGSTSSSGGATSSSGGSTGSSGDSKGSGGTGTGENGSGGGCAIAGGTAQAGSATAVLLALGLLLRRRSRSRR
ncbi:MAG TPA: PHB depolymerase family esterase [Polyangia bacterium]|nr:PHB depolymerase family esterase [Polyangia bacterium]